MGFSLHQARWQETAPRGSDKGEGGQRMYRQVCLRTAYVSIHHLALRPGRGSPGITVRLGTSRSWSMQLSSVFCVYPHLPMLDQPHAWHPTVHTLRRQALPHCIFLPNKPPQSPDQEQRKAHTGVSLACSFIGRAGQPQSTAMSHAWGQSLVLLSAVRAEVTRPVCVPTSSAVSPVLIAPP